MHRSRRCLAALALLVIALPRLAVAESLAAHVDDAVGGLVAVLGTVLFWEPFSVVGTGSEAGIRHGVPLIILVLAGGAIFFTLYMRFINIRAFRHAIAVVRGHYDRPEDAGQISHAQALTAAVGVASSAPLCIDHAAASSPLPSW